LRQNAFSARFVDRRLSGIQNNHLLAALLRSDCGNNSRRARSDNYDFAPYIHSHTSDAG
jgi:hypothetical protein